MGARRGSTNLAFLLSEKVFQLASVALVNIVILRSLGPTEFGYLGAATAILAMALPLALFGQVAAVRFLSLGRYSEAALVRITFVLSTAGALVGTAALLILGLFLIQEARTAHLLVILSLATLSRPLSAVDAWFQAKKLVSKASGSRVAAILFASVGRVVVSLTTQSLETLAWLVVLENLLGGIFMFTIYWSVRKKYSGAAALKVPFAEIIKLSWPLLVSGLAVILYMRLSQPLLLLLADSHEVGIYSAAANLADASSFIPTAILTAVLPGIVAIHAKNQSVFFERSQKLFQVAVAGGYTVAAGGVLLGPVVVQALYGPAYSQTGQLLQILCIGAPFVFLGVLRNVWIVTEGLQLETLWLSIITVVVNVVLNLWLIPIYGATGAAVTTILAHCCNAFVGNLIFPRMRPILRQQVIALNPISAFRVLFDAVKYRRL
jgi:PST family polysaccharide transporter